MQLLWSLRQAMWQNLSEGRGRAQDRTDSEDNSPVRQVVIHKADLHPVDRL